MIYYVQGYNFKGRPYHIALHDAGHTAKFDGADVVLFDRDWYMHNDRQPRYQVLAALNQGSSVMVYPHSALPPWWYDGLIKIQPYVKCVFVIGQGQKEAMRVIEPSVHCEAVGWPWCPQRPYSKPEQVKTVLFGPVHPAGGKLRSEAVRANREIFRELKHLQKKLKLHVIIRYIGDLETQGLKPYPDFEWIPGRPDGQTIEIDRADVVIAEGTMMYLSVARGRPTIGINQHLPVRANKMSEKYCPHHWSEYGPGLAYPVNYSEGRLEELMNQSVSGEQTEWRRRFIGEDMDGRKFAELVEKLARK